MDGPCGIVIYSAFFFHIIRNCHSVIRVLCVCFVLCISDNINTARCTAFTFDENNHDGMT